MRPHVRRARVTHDRWLISYADFITLLFGLFVVLFAFSKADQKKQSQIPKSISAAFRSLSILSAVNGGSSGSGAEDTVTPTNNVMGVDILSPAQVKQDLDRISHQLAQTLSNQVANHTVSMHMGRDGLVISLQEAGFFASGSATPQPETLSTLRRIAAALAQSSYDLRIEGHTDNIPIQTPAFNSNWELSTARATSIARMLIGLHLISPSRISAAGYSEFHPVASNDTPEGRAENRRVDIVVLPRTSIDLSRSLSSAPSVPSTSWKKITEDH